MAGSAKVNQVDEILAALNPHQQEAVCHPGGALLIFAGAGSGKTRVLAHRIAYLIAQGRALPSQVLAVTFTNKAAGELKQRIGGLLGEETPVWAGTFHSFCARLLRRFAGHLGRDSTFVIFDEADQITLLKRVLEELGYGDDNRVSPAAVLHLIERDKDRLRGPEEFAPGLPDPVHEAAARAYPRYQKRLLDNNAMDFGDLIFFAVRLLKENPEVRTACWERYEQVLVDEFQDINLAQYHLVSELGRGHGNVCVVGDDDQSIYGWRGADVGLIFRFKEDFPHAKVVTLERNYRSTQTILDAAYHVIRNNQQRAEKRLWTDQAGGQAITVHVCTNDQEEAHRVASLIRSGAEQEGHPLTEFAVLYRTNAQSLAYERAMRDWRLPYQLIGAVGFYERAEVKDILAYLRLIHNPADEVSLRRIINMPRRGIGSATIARLQHFAQAQNCSLLEAARQAERWRDEVGRAASRVEGFIGLLDELGQTAKRLPLGELVREVVRVTGYEEMLRQEGTPEAISRLENLEELVNAAFQFAVQNPEMQHSLAGFLETASLMSSLDEGGEGERVNLLTMHSAKGLEFGTVFLVGMEENLFPHPRSVGEEELEEERRLCYVALTRAKHKAHVALALSRMRFGKTEPTRPSRFLREIPLGLLDGDTYIVTAPGETAQVRRRGVDVRAVVERHRQLAATASPGAAGRRGEGTTARFQVGQRVMHEIWGLGVVVAVAKGDNVIQVAFHDPAVGLKRLQADLAPLREV